jgi:glucokinase
MSILILAGDVGGTTTRLGLFERAPVRPRPVAVQSFATPDYPGLDAVLTAFLGEGGAAGASGAPPIGAACIGVAGPIVGETARLTNAPWLVDAGEIARRLTGARVTLLNDLEAMAHVVPVLEARELHALQAGVPDPDGNMALIAAGTGLGEAVLHRVGGRLVTMPTEGGHADWAARRERDMDVLRDLTTRFGRAEIEQVISGTGLLNLHQVTHQGPCAAARDGSPASVSAAAMTRACSSCVEALELFVEAYGAEAGNLALRTMAAGGVFVGGGIARKILPALEDGRFMRAFRAKAPFEALMARIPVKVILHPEAGLLGAAVHAAGEPTSLPSGS